MCGISGILSSRSVLDAKKRVSRIVAHQHSRGPDLSKVVVISESPSIVLGHNRLSIIDLSPDANQPMYGVYNRSIIVFNGEIYNYLELKDELSKLGIHFSSRSDTEVLVKSLDVWGKDALPKLNGMFAFCYINFDKNVAWLARDRFGVKPLYYLEINGSIYFASSAAALADMNGLDVNLDYLARGVQYGYFDTCEKDTQYSGLRQVEPGHSIEIPLHRPQKFVSRKYYNLEHRVYERFIEIAEYSVEQQIEELFELTRQAVKIRLRSDVPVGVSLSGGLDSSSILSIGHEFNDGLKLLSYGDPADSYSEARYASLVAEGVDCEVEWINVDSINWTDSLERVLRQQEAPFASLSIIAQNEVFRRASDLGIRVMLGGQGGDESLMGYRKYMLAGWRDVRKYGSASDQLVYALGMFLMISGDMRGVLYRMSKHGARALGGKGRQSLLRLPRSARTSIAVEHELGVGRELQIRDIKVSSLPTLLRYEDRNSMGNSIETRLPFIDYRLVETGIALNQALKINWGYGKWCLRKIMEKRLPKEVVFARWKRGFDVDNNKIIRGGVGRYIRKRLADRKGEIDGYLSSSIDINEVFSDKFLIQRPGTMTDALTLMWLIFRKQSEKHNA